MFSNGDWQCIGIFGDDLLDFFFMGATLMRNKDVIHDANNKIGFVDAQCNG